MKEQLYCVVCNKELKGLQKKFCCNACKQKDNYNKKKILNGNTLFNQDSRGLIRKLQLIEDKGGKCNRCGYNKNISALDFHHTDPLNKEFSLDKRTLGNTSMERILEEAKKCELLCANCHREEHNPEASMDNMIQFKNDNIINFNPKTFNPDYVPEKNYCECGSEISYGAKRCRKCFLKSRQVVDRPTKEELLELIKTTPFTTIAKQFGVSDNAIRKWCKSYDLPFKQKDINLIR